MPQDGQDARAGTAAPAAAAAATAVSGGGFSFEVPAPADSKKPAKPAKPAPSHSLEARVGSAQRAVARLRAELRALQAVALPVGAAEARVVALLCWVGLQFTMIGRQGGYVHCKL